MMPKVIKKVFLSYIPLISLIVFSSFPFKYVEAIYIMTSTNVEISAYVNVSDPVTPPSGGGGGGGGGTSIPTTVNFSGMGYPLSRVTILKDGIIAVTTISDPAARFAVSLTNITAGVHNFSVYGEDSNGLRSLTFSFPIFITEGATIDISGIFLSPTINIDKSEVRKGDTLIVFGQTIPSSNVNIVFHSDQEIIRQTTTDSTGLYKYDMDTTPLDYGDHNVKSKTTLLDSSISATSVELPFLVGLISRLKDSDSCGGLIGDLNCDNRVNLVDFSIMAYWYKKTDFPAKIDLSGDGKITLSDFSIMAYHWTG